MFVPVMLVFNFMIGLGKYKDCAHQLVGEGGGPIYFTRQMIEICLCRFYNFEK